jgi:hypothetical protein
MKIKLLKKIAKTFKDTHTVELLLLILILSLFTFLHGGEIFPAKVIFLAFPILYLPTLLVRRRHLYRSHMIIFFAWLIFLFVSFLSTISSISLALSVPEFFELLSIFLYFMLFYLVVDGWKDIKYLSNSILVVGFILSFMSFYFIFNPPVRFPVINLVYAKYGHNHLVNYLVFVLPIAMVRFLRSERRKQIFGYGGLLIFFFLSLYLSFSRAALFIVPLMTLLLIWYFKPSRIKRFYLLFLGVLPLVFLVGILLVSQSSMIQEFIAPIRTEKYWLWRQIVKPVKDEARFEYLRHAILGLRQKPIIGSGPGTFRLISTRFRRDNTFSWFAHNSLIQTFSDSGLFGISAFVSILILVALSIKISKKKQSYIIPLILGVGGSFLQSLFNFNFEFQAIYVLFWVILASIIKLSGNQAQQPLTRKWSLTILALSITCFGFSMSSLFSSYYLGVAKGYESVSEAQSFKYYKKSITFPSLDHYRYNHFLDYLNSDKQKTSFNVPKDYVVIWNKEDPEIQFKLAKYYENSDDPKAYYFFSKAIEYDPSNLGHSLAFASYLINKDNYIVAQRAITRLGILKYKGLISQDERSYLEKFTSDKKLVLTKKDMQDFINSNPSKTDNFYAQLFYVIGLRYLAQDQSDEARFFWNLSAKIIPDMSLYNLEFASLLFYKFNDETQAKAQIKECIKYKPSNYHCRQFLEIHNLFKPGHFQKEIVDLDSLSFEFYKSQSQESLNQKQLNDAIIHIFSYPKVCSSINSYSCNEIVQILLENQSYAISALKNTLTSKSVDYPLHFYSYFTYLFGNEVLKIGKLHDSEVFWKLSTDISPDMSHYRLELASLYFNKLNKKDKAQEQLDNCLNSDISRPHCKQYKSLGELQPPGSLIAAIKSLH